MVNILIVLAVNYYDGLTAAVDGRCNSSSIELMIDNQPLNETVIYKPVGTSGLFVTCHKCDNNPNKPSWHSLIGSQNRLASCSETEVNVCSNRIDSRTRGLQFTAFTPSLAGTYECRISGGFRSAITISVLDPPFIITSPTSQIKKGTSTPRTLTCEASTNVGQVLYHWEGKSFGETEWNVVTERRIDGTSYTTYTSTSHQYRCVASNDAGATNSEIANITILTSTINSQDMIVPVGGKFSLTCTSSVSSNAMFSWTRDRSPVIGQSNSHGDTSTLTPTDVKIDDAGSYVCSVRVGTLVVMSNAITIDTVIIDPPMITVHPVGDDVPIGMNVTLQCRATGLGSIKYSWQRHHAGDWVTVSTDSTTSYTATTSGSYRCNVSNEAGSVPSNRTRVNIYGPPTITIQPTSQLSTIGMTITLNCEGAGKGLLIYYWKEKQQGNRWGVINSSNSSTLTIRNIQNSIQFRCIVSNEAGNTTSNPAGITVLEILTHPQSKLVALRSTINFTCTSSVSSNVTFSWTHNGRSISESSTIDNTSILTITSVRSSDAGSYTCIVRGGSVSVMSNTATLTVYGPPVITDHLTNDDIPVGENVTFTCSASGQGTLEYSWERSSGSSWTTVSDNTTSYTTDTTLAIGQYMYRCRVSNEAGLVVSNIAIVNVYGPPTITTHPASQMTTIKLNVILNCEGTGRGSITYRWKTSDMNGRQWMDISNSNTERLVVGILEQSQQYRCVVSNEAGSTRSNVAAVTVLKIITHPQDKVVPLNSTANLTCISSLSSNVTFSWTHNGRSISGSSMTGGTSILTITSVRQTDVGSYVCTVRSGSVSVTSDMVTVAVYGPPVITTQPISTNVSVGGNITLKCQAIGQSPLTFIWETYTEISNWHAIDISNTTVYTVRAETDGNFMYRCRVENEAGSVTSDEASINVFFVVLTAATDTSIVGTASIDVKVTIATSTITSHPVTTITASASSTTNTTTITNIATAVATDATVTTTPMITITDTYASIATTIRSLTLLPTLSIASYDNNNNNSIIGMIVAIVVIVVLVFIVITVVVVGIIVVWKEKKSKCDNTTSESVYYSTIDETKLQRGFKSKPGAPHDNEVDDKQLSIENTQYMEIVIRADCSVANKVVMQDNPSYSLPSKHQVKMQDNPAYATASGAKQ